MKNLTQTKMFPALVFSALVTSELALPVKAFADVDSDFKERPVDRFSLYTGDGNYKQAYRWSFNENGEGPPVTIFLNHGVGGEWYDEIDSRYGPCGPDYLSPAGDFSGSAYEGLCEVNEQGDELYLADFQNYHVSVGPDLEEFMLKKIVGSTQFAAWYWQDAFSQLDSPVNVFMVGRYNVVKDPSHLDNALYWLNATDRDTTTRDMQPPYNFDGYGLDGINGDFRPMHAAPDISGFDNMFLYKAIAEQFPSVSLDKVIIEGRSNGGSAMIAMASDYHIWPQHMKDFWSRNLPVTESPELEPEPEPEIQVIPGLSLEEVLNNPTLTSALENLLAGYTEQDLLNAINGGQTLSLASNTQIIEGSAGEQVVQQYSQQNQLQYQQQQEPETNNENNSEFDPTTFRTQLANYLHGDFYGNVKMAHAFYPGCYLDGLMQKDENLAPDTIEADGDNANGYKVAIPLMMSFGNEDSLYSNHCDNRVAEADHQTDVAGVLTTSSISNGTQSVTGEVFTPARHGFDYKDVYKNLDNDLDNQNRAAESRRAIERVVNQAITQMGMNGSYSLPENID